MIFSSIVLAPFISLFICTSFNFTFELRCEVVATSYHSNFKSVLQGCNFDSLTFWLLHTLQKRWIVTLNKTSCALLKHVKKYHTLWPSWQERLIICRAGCRRMQSLLGIWKKQKLATIYERRKRNKLFRLTNDKLRKAICRCQKRKRKNQIVQEDQNKNTVINIPNVSLSESKVNLLSRGLSFCPRPSALISSS